MKATPYQPGAPTQRFPHMLRLPRAWYPICLSKAIKTGKVMGINAFNAGWAIYRGRDGRVGVLHHQCAHVGADLSQGFVSGAHLACPLHHWRYNRQGETQMSGPYRKCTPRQLLSLPVVERWGLIFVFLGREADYPLPNFTDVPESVSSSIFTSDYPAPYQMVGLNGFDEHHLGPVHGRKLLSPATITTPSNDEIVIRYQAQIKGDRFRDKCLRRLGAQTVDISTHCIGGSLLFFRHHQYDCTAVFGLLPLEEHKTRLFIGLHRPHRQHGIKWIKRLSLSVQKAFVMHFVRDDLKALMNSRYQPEGLVADHDRTMIAWRHHYDQLPLFDPEDSP